MKNFIPMLMAACAAIVITSCQNSPQHDAAKGIALMPNDSLFHISEGGYDFNIILPKDMMIENSPSISVNSATGELNIQLGNQFWIVASQEKGDMKTVKAELNEDMLFMSRIIEESNNSLLYQRVLPDGSAYDYSYKCSNEVSGKPYFFRTCEEGEFTMENVGRMKVAISSVHSAV
ncbi:MAG: hypothetical protein ACKVOR_13185 [Flavobacteriales bacterium]